MYIVYVPAWGYSLSNDTGKLFQFESQARHMVAQARKRGANAWFEFDHRLRGKFGNK